MGSNFWRKLRFSLMYWRDPPWDSEISPPELVEFIGSHPPGAALDLGCGTGTNTLTLVESGWQAVGVDFAPPAIRRAKRKAHKAGLEVDFYVADVTKLDFIKGPFDLILDVGCFHAIPPERQAAYRANLERLLSPGGDFMLYLFYRQPGSAGPGVLPEEIEAFRSFLEVYRREDGTNLGERPSTWFWMRRRPEQPGILGR
jgi:SAM-dependent methyltransferase